MDTTAFVDIRFERVFGTSTIMFRNMRIPQYLVLSSFISLICTGAALFFLSSGGEDLTPRDISWAVCTWAFGAFLHLPILLWLRGNKGLKCEYCQERPPAKGKYCRVCNDRYDLSGAYDAAEEHINNHIQKRFDERNKGSLVRSS